MPPEEPPLSQLLDFLPILVFVLAYFFFDVYTATGALMVAVALQILILWLMKRPIGSALKLTFWVSMIAGSLTLWFRNETFIQWKPTVINWAMASALLIGKFIAGKDLLQKVMGHQLELPEKAWVHLNLGWATAFFVAGALNLFVAYNFSMDIWVSYKLIGGFGLTFCYIIITMIYLNKGGYLSELETGVAADLQTTASGLQTTAADPQTAEADLNTEAADLNSAAADPKSGNDSP